MKIPAWTYDPYVVINLAVVSSYVPLRFNLDPDCQLFKQDPFGITRELQVWGLLVVSLYLKFKRSSSVAEFFPILFMYAKFAILVCTFIVDHMYAAWYAVIFFVLFFVLQQSEDRSANKVCALNTGNFGTVEDDTESTWIVEFYTTWARNCVPFTATFNALSNKYSNKYLKFGKVDIGRFKSLATKFKISLDVMGNHELPTIILFEKGKEVPNQRLPALTKDGKVNENYVLLTFDNLTKYFQLERRFEEAQRKAIKDEKSKGKQKAK